MLDPKTLPTDSPPSSANAAIVETESSGREVVTDKSINPAAISDKPKTRDKANTYFIVLSLTKPIKNKEAINRGMLYKFMLKHWHFASEYSSYSLIFMTCGGNREILQESWG
jgi:hypothetical protein